MLWICLKFWLFVNLEMLTIIFPAMLEPQNKFIWSG